MRRFALAALLALLTACGGGSPEDDDRAFVGPPDCKARPEACA